jgi:lipopolysaccharide biosynthesis protein
MTVSVTATDVPQDTTTAAAGSVAGRRPLILAFYLPQFHPTPENDRWWGPGFTEWRNVVRATPRYAGHEQPHIPADLGFYDLRLDEAREAQAELAGEYGVDGFCMYDYWFDGRRLLNEPLDRTLATGRSRMPFCLCWANESWTRAWNGAQGEFLVRQRYSPEDDRRHIRSLLPAIGDDRYIRVDGRPLLLVYRVGDLPDPRQTAEIWREELTRAHLGNPLLARVESVIEERGDPRELGFDVAVEFQPDWANLPKSSTRRGARAVARRLGVRRLVPDATAPDLRVDYETMVAAMRARPRPQYPRLPCVTPRWDNSARRRRGAVILTGSTPEKYGAWLESVLEESRDQPCVFVNAWNEWAEGAHLEPDLRWGRGYLEAHRAAVTSVFGRPPQHRS